MNVVESILRSFRCKGDSQYGGECVSQLEHALQCAMLAENEGAEPALIVAALVHDIGHLLHELPDNSPNEAKDDHHETSGYHFLRSCFPESVTEPVRLHVAAKRYLCAIDRDYREQLSKPSRISLTLQGGPMTNWELSKFKSNRFHANAIRLRRWDDGAKIVDLITPSLDHFRPYLEQVASDVC